MNVIHLIIGVPGSGKTHILKELDADPSLAERYLPVLHDDSDIPDYSSVLAQCAKLGNWPVVGECPFRASVLIDELVKKGVGKDYIKAYYLIEPLDTTIKRYEARENKPFAKAFITNWYKYSQRSPRYTQKELIIALKEALRG